MKKKFELFVNFIKDRSVATLAPTSKSAIHKISRKINFGKKNIFIEFGPGTGVISRYIIERMSKDSEILMIEKNKNLYLTAKQLKAKNVHVFNECASNVGKIVKEHFDGNFKADYIISGIPFSMIKKKVKTKIVSDAFELLAPGGKFILYQFCLSKNGVRGLLKKTFRNIDISLELKNFPPLFIYEASKLT